MKRIATVAALLVLLASTSQAQQGSSAQARVRISTIVFGSDPFQLTGTLVRLDPDTLAIEQEHDRTRIAVPVAAIRRFEMSAGQRTRTGKGALYGLIGGVVGGAGSVVLLCALDEDGCDEPGSPLGTGGVAAFGATIVGLGLGLVGTGVGAIVGSRIRSERWQELSLDSLRLGFGDDRRLRAGVRFSF